MKTRHAQIRAQQRGIPPLIDCWLDEYGEMVYDGHGGVQMVFTKGNTDQFPAAGVARWPDEERTGTMILGATGREERRCRRAFPSTNMRARSG